MAQGENINITWSPDGKYLAVGSRDDQISFLDARKMKASSSIQQMAFNHEVNEISWSKDGAEFYATTGQGSIEVFSFPQLAPVKTLRAHTAGCYCIAFDPTGACFAAGSADALVSIWDVRDKVCLQTLPRLDWPVRPLPLHPSLHCSSRSATRDATFSRRRLPRRVRRQCGSRSARRTAQVRTLSFSHDGQLLASAAEDHAIDIAYVATGALAHRFDCLLSCDFPFSLVCFVCFSGELWCSTQSIWSQRASYRHTRRLVAGGRSTLSHWRCADCSQVAGALGHQQPRVEPVPSPTSVRRRRRAG